MIFSAMFVYHGALRGAGDTVFPMFITLFSMWIVRIPLSIWLSNHYGSDGIWWSIPIGWTMGFAITVIYYHGGRWKKRGLN